MELTGLMFVESNLEQLLVVNTFKNGDKCFAEILVPKLDIVATGSSKEECVEKIKVYYDDFIELWYLKEMKTV